MTQNNLEIQGKFDSYNFTNRHQRLFEVLQTPKKIGAFKNSFVIHAASVVSARIHDQRKQEMDFLLQYRLEYD
jgi:hypothetical protein